MGVSTGGAGFVAGNMARRGGSSGGIKGGIHGPYKTGKTTYKHGHKHKVEKMNTAIQDVWTKYDIVVNRIHKYLDGEYKTEDAHLVEEAYQDFHNAKFDAMMYYDWEFPARE